MDLSNPFERACERAAAYRRQLAIDAGHPPGNLDERICTVPAWHESPVGDGWLHAGFVADGVVSESLAVWWHPDTDRVKIERPPVVDRTPRLKPDPGPPIWWSLWGNTGCARPGYVYTYDGQDYSPEDAAALVTHLRDDEGWTWRPTED